MMKKCIFLLVGFLITGGGAGWALAPVCSAESEQPAAKAAARIAPMPYQPIELRQIHVEGLIGRRIQMTIENNLL
ncbi:MAG: hypothetical protein RMI90_10640, partial [Thermoguttaceae bacterium]|nr:hypothetical protein [Thermoguttaceae bacterium]